MNKLMKFVSDKFSASVKEALAADWVKTRTLMSASLLGLGIGKIVLHSSTFAAHLIDICSSGSSTMFLLNSAMHCWGCPVALIGAALLLDTIIAKHLAQKSSTYAPMQKLIATT